ncbi:MAG: phenylalanine--tRNA ligase subunit beta [Actinomycetota bacterium]|nr:phenylalanine--tRNA ligase subunit beta [Actinomycetota bacterium]
MKIPLSWLREFVDVDLPLDDLLEVMGRNGLEVEDVKTPGAGVSGVRVARVLDVSEHPNADKLVVATVDDGEHERTVCAGVRNFARGDLVPFASPGASLPGGLRIKRRDVRGVVSDGMLCSPRELEVVDDHSGIMVLPEPIQTGHLESGHIEAGVDIHEIFSLGEPVIDVAVQADRGDLHSVFGVARDLAAILGIEVREPSTQRAEEQKPSDGPVPVRVEATEGCSTYVGWVVEGLKQRASPWWLRRRLEACGVRSISNLVDVTNYVMLELGQPLHAFDLGSLRGPEISVRWAQSGESLTTLDGRVRQLRPGDLVIADRDRAVALAGVMGGEDTEVGATTTRILLEAAAFDPAAVRRTSRRLGLVSEASIRFERRVDPAGTWRAAARAVDLLVELADGRDLGARVDGAGEPRQRPIRVDTARTARFLGLPELTAEDQAALLRHAGVMVTPTGGGLLEATPPTWRRDLERPADLAEEVARLYGYEKIPASLPSIGLLGGLNRRQRAERDIRRAVLAAGFHEAQTIPFVAPNALCLLAPHDTHRVTLQNPVSKDAASMRPGLVEGLLGVARHNVGQGRAGLAAFELGRIFRVAGGPVDDVVGRVGNWRWTGPTGEVLPTQPLTLGLLAYGPRHGHDWLDRDATWSIFDLLSALDEVAARLAPAATERSWGLERAPADRPALHPGRTAALHWRGLEVGIVGELHSSEAAARDLPTPTVVAELLLEPLWQHLAHSSIPARQAPLLPRHPAVAVDVAVAVDEDVLYAAVEEAVRAGAGELLDGLWWFDEFRGPQLGVGRRSLAFHLRLQAFDRQLTDADAEAVIEAVAGAVAEIGGSLRR